VNRFAGGAKDIVTGAVSTVDDVACKIVEPPTKIVGRVVEGVGKTILLPWNAVRALWHWDTDCLWKGRTKGESKEDKKKWTSIARKTAVVLALGALTLAPATLAPTLLLAQSPTLALKAMLLSPTARWLLWPGFTGWILKKLGKGIKDYPKAPVNALWGTGITAALTQVPGLLAKLGAGLTSLPLPTLTVPYFGWTLGGSAGTGLLAGAKTVLGSIEGWVSAGLSKLGITGLMSSVSGSISTFLAGSLGITLAPATITFIITSLIAALGVALFRKRRRGKGGGEPSQPSSKEDLKPDAISEPVSAGEKEKEKGH